MERANRNWSLSARAIVLALSASGCVEGPGLPSDAGTGPADSGGGSAIVATLAGRVEGRVEGGLQTFRGIPYAEPPLGPLRFRPVGPHPGWSGVRSALEVAPGCPQTGVNPFTDPDVQSEDCLVLDVWAHTDTRPRPVLVFVHGGGFANGTGSAPLYEASTLAAEADVVVVTLNYRLGALGFLALPELAAESGDDSVGNYGLRDVVEALRWVRDNIGAFGGDPAQVTVFGESAGGAIICSLLGIPEADSLFRAAIVQSAGCPELEPAVSRAAAFETGRAILEAAGCAGSTDLLACARALTPDAILDAVATQPTGVLGFTSLGPVIDGSFFVESPLRRLEAGRRADIPLVTGATADEFELFRSFARSPPYATEAGYEAYLRELLPEQADALLAMYPPSGYGGRPELAFSQLATDLIFVCPTRALARVAAAGPQPSFHYFFDEATGGALAQFGAYHGAELSFLFDRYDPGLNPLSPEDRTLGATMRAHWGAFARNGRPATAELDWAPYDPATPSSRRFSTSGEQNIADPSEGRCEMLASLGLAR